MAKTITLTPVNDVVAIDKEFTDFVKNRLKGLPIAHGDEISVMILGNSMDFKITKTNPKRSNQNRQNYRIEYFNRNIN